MQLFCLVIMPQPYRLLRNILNVPPTLFCLVDAVFSLFLDMYILDDEKCDGLDSSDDPPYYPHSKAVKDRSTFTILGSTRFARPRFLNSLSLPSKKLRSISDPKTPSSGSRTPTELKTQSPRRNRTVTEPSVYSPNQGDVFTSVFNGRGMPKSPTVSLETSFVGTRSEEQLADGRLVRGGGSGLGLSGLGGHAVAEHHREQSSRERLAGDGGSSSGGNVGGGGGGGGTQFKSRSQSFNTDTTTSGISSMSSSPSRETVGNPEPPEVEPDSSDCVSLNTVVSAKTVKTLSSLSPQPQTNHMSTSKSSNISLVPPGSSHTLPRRAQSLKSCSVTTIKSLADCSFIYTSPRDALGYATLKRLQQQRIHPSLSHSEALASPAKDVLFTDTITMKTGSLDSRLTPRRWVSRYHGWWGWGCCLAFSAVLLFLNLKTVCSLTLTQHDSSVAFVLPDVPLPSPSAATSGRVFAPLLLFPSG